MKIVRAFLAGLVAVALVRATPLDLLQKPGVKPNQLPMPPVSPCAVYAKPAPHRTIIDEIDQPMIAIHEEAGTCIATAVPPNGFFSADEEEAVDDAMPPQDKALLEGSGLFGALLLVTAYATRKLRPSRHRHAIVRRRPGSRRSMAII